MDPELHRLIQALHQDRRPRRQLVELYRLPLCHGLAQIGIRRVELRAALPLYEQSRDILEQAYSKTHPLYIRTLANMATLEADRGNYAAARPLYDPGDRLGGRVPRGQPWRRQAGG